MYERRVMLRLKLQDTYIPDDPVTTDEGGICENQLLSRISDIVATAKRLQLEVECVVCVGNGHVCHRIIASPESIVLDLWYDAMENDTMARIPIRIQDPLTIVKKRKNG